MLRYCSRHFLSHEISIARNILKLKIRYSDEGGGILPWIVDTFQRNSSYRQCFRLSSGFLPSPEFRPSTLWWFDQFHQSLSKYSTRKRRGEKRTISIRVYRSAVAHLRLHRIHPVRLTALLPSYLSAHRPRLTNRHDCYWSTIVHEPSLDMSTGLITVSRDHLYDPVSAAMGAVPHSLVCENRRALTLCWFYRKHLWPIVVPLCCRPCIECWAEVSTITVMRSNSQSIVSRHFDPNFGHANMPERSAKINSNWRPNSQRKPLWFRAPIHCHRFRPAFWCRYVVQCYWNLHENRIRLSIGNFGENYRQRERGAGELNLQM